MVYTRTVRRKNVVATIVDGVWQQPQVNDDGHHAIINSSTSEVDQIVLLLSQVVLRAQSLSAAAVNRHNQLTTLLRQTNQGIFT